MLVRKKKHIGLINILPRISLATFRYMMNNCGVSELMNNKILTSQHYDTSYFSVECIKYIQESCTVTQ